MQTRRTMFSIWHSFAAAGLLAIAVPGLAQEDNENDGYQVPPPNDRFYIETQGDVRVTAAVPSAAETFAVFGFSLYGRNIQPVWVQIENLGDKNLWFLPSGVDSAYFTPIETSFRQQERIPVLDWALGRNYYDKSMSIEVKHGGSQSGYVFTRLDQGTKTFNVDVAGEDDFFRMSFYIPVPGLRLDHYEVSFNDIYSEEELQDVDASGLVAGLEAYPCCVTNKSGKKFGDPLNIAIVGEIADVYYAFLRANWDETETIYFGSLWNTIKSAFASSEYRYSPVSALYVDGRSQDAALQKARSRIHERNHLRLWLTPLRFEGKPVWIGQISRDIGVRLTWRTITTHKIDPDVDEARE